MKTPPKQFQDNIARDMTEAFIRGEDTDKAVVYNSFTNMKNRVALGKAIFPFLILFIFGLSSCTMVPAQLAPIENTPSNPIDSPRITKNSNCYRNLHACYYTDINVNFAAK